MNPDIDVPLSVLITLAGGALIHVVASLALSGVLPASDIDATSGFSEAFFSRGIYWAGKRSCNGLMIYIYVGFAADFLLATGHVAAIGEIIVLPMVVVVSFMGQPRLMFSMAEVLLMLTIEHINIYLVLLVGY